MGLITNEAEIAAIKIGGATIFMFYTIATLHVRFYDIQSLQKSGTL